VQNGRVVQELPDMVADPMEMGGTMVGLKAAAAVLKMPEVLQV
jgi:hypothetical protein